MFFTSIRNIVGIFVFFVCVLGSQRNQLIYFWGGKMIATCLFHLTTKNFWRFEMLFKISGGQWVNFPVSPHGCEVVCIKQVALLPHYSSSSKYCCQFLLNLLLLHSLQICRIFALDSRIT